MSEERTADTTRIVLRSFGVMVTTYQERMAQLLEQASRADLAAEEALHLAASALALSARLTRRLREVNEHVLALEERALAQLQEQLAQRFPGARVEPEE
ncbi:MAG: hypothetical protein RMJ05_04095 [Thermomicrobium sp.]|nr:hypothetical protein [Thermomicrobium sp.]MDW8005879.1 hypothetical protein [Thermomicrobium sp.]